MFKGVGGGGCRGHRSFPVLVERRLLFVATLPPQLLRNKVVNTFLRL